ncbi:MAG: macro domain-containing protein [Bacteroidetes bacterium]|nr:MAG: macro domain-containing protein [Bacteroidota bacterium]
MFKKEQILRGKTCFEITKGDIVKQNDMDAIVNAANAFLRIGGGVAGVIHKAAGPDLENEAMKKGPIKPGEAVITKAYNLPNKHVIHVLGPVYDRDIPHDQLLAKCYINALKLCEEYNLKSIAFPAVSTGVFGYPVEEAAPVAVQTIYKEMQNLKSLKRIRLVIWSDKDYDEHVKALKKL